MSFSGHPSDRQYMETWETYGDYENYYVTAKIDRTIIYVGFLVSGFEVSGNPKPMKTSKNPRFILTFC